MRSTGTQTLWLWPRRIFVTTSTTLATTSTSTSTIPFSFTPRAAVPTTPTVAIATSPAATTASLISISTAATAATIPVAASPALSDELRRDRSSVLSRAENLEGWLLHSLGLGRQHVGDEYPVDGELCVDAYDIANAGSLIEEGSIEDALWLLGSGLSPSVGTIITLACKLDFETSRHSRSI